MQMDKGRGGIETERAVTLFEQQRLDLVFKKRRVLEITARSGQYRASPPLPLSKLPLGACRILHLGCGAGEKSKDHWCVCS